MAEFNVSSKNNPTVRLITSVINEFINTIPAIEKYQGKIDISYDSDCQPCTYSFAALHGYEQGTNGDHIVLLISQYPSPKRMRGTLWKMRIPNDLTLTAEELFSLLQKSMPVIASAVKPMTTPMQRDIDFKRRNLLAQTSLAL